MPRNKRETPPDPNNPPAGWSLKFWQNYLLETGQLEKPMRERWDNGIDGAIDQEKRSRQQTRPDEAKPRFDIKGRSHATAKYSEVRDLLQGAPEDRGDSRANGGRGSQR